MPGKGPWPHPVTHFIHPAQVHEEFKQNIENVSVEMLLRKFAESKGTGREKPGELGHPWGSGSGATSAGKEQGTDPPCTLVSSSDKWANDKSISAAHTGKGFDVHLFFYKYI